MQTTIGAHQNERKAQVGTSSGIELTTVRIYIGLHANLGVEAEE
jgi:hypothetical protein